MITKIINSITYTFLRKMSILMNINGVPTGRTGRKKHIDLIILIKTLLLTHTN